MKTLDNDQIQISQAVLDNEERSKKAKKTSKENADSLKNLNVKLLQKERSKVECAFGCGRTFVSNSNYHRHLTDNGTGRW